MLSWDFATHPSDMDIVLLFAELLEHCRRGASSVPASQDLLPDSHILSLRDRGKEGFDEKSLFDHLQVDISRCSVRCR